MKTARWKKLLCDISIWLIAEIILNLMGIDDLADYSEFLLGNKSTPLLNNTTATFVILI
ncbi:MAG: hypothetical protein AAF208_12010 [Cyanobacteria bacterium P01_A01_bin.45]